jgi:hypothetical protein
MLRRPGLLRRLILVLATLGFHIPVHAQHILLLRDEGMSKLSLVDMKTPGKDWQVPVPAGRDLQLVGRGRVLLGTATGFEEREIETGNKVVEASSWPGTITARRLSNGSTILLGVNWLGRQGIVLLELNGKLAAIDTIAYAEFRYARLLRETPAGTFLIAADNTIIEGDRSGNITWRAAIVGHESPHAWQAVRSAGGETIVSSGYPSDLQIFSGEGKLVRTIGGPPDVNPHFFAGFQILANGNIVVTNWQGHGPSFGSMGTQLLEYNPKGDLVWSWKQDATKFSSLQGVIVLDGLDLKRLHVENELGVLSPR